MQPSLIAHAKERGIDLIRIDPDRPLLEQGPFDCVIHKLYGAEWNDQLQQFSSLNPGVPIIDSPEAIERLHNRVSMLEVVERLKIEFKNENFAVPKQVVVWNVEDLTRDNAIEEMNLLFPVIAKPLMADGSSISHNMYLVFDSEGLQELTTPIVLQEFVNHGGVVFKIYVAGSMVKRVMRKSLPNISDEKMKTLRGSLPFARISNLTENDKKHEEDDSVDHDDHCDFDGVEMPSEGFVTELASAMRVAMGLNLFNFDVIRDSRDSNRYLIIDINYFPGYAKMPGYESVLTEFFWDVVNKKNMVMVSAGE